MPWEQTKNTETYKEKYKDFREMLSNSNLSDEEKNQLQESYSYACDKAHNKAQEMCKELQSELAVYNEMKELSREDIRLVQRVIGIPKSQRDGIKGPLTFSQYFSYTQKYPSLSKISLRQIIAEYQKHKNIFHNQTWTERKNLQNSLGLKDDGIYGAKTFWAMYENISSMQDNTQETSPVEKIQKKHKETEQVTPIESIPKTENMSVSEKNRADTIRTEAYTSEETLKNTPERNKLSPKELKSNLIWEAKTYSKQLLKELQRKLWFNPPDGSFWPISVNKAIELQPNITSIQGFFDYYEINTDIDTSLSQSNNLWELQENFLGLYWEYIENITQNMDLPATFVEAIIWKETTYGKNLNSNSGSKWLMQLTESAFDDMRGDIREWKRKDHQKVRRYQEIFKSIDLDVALSVNIWNKWPAKARIPSHIINAFTTIQESDNIWQIQESVDILKNHIKWNAKEYDHEANIIIGTVYLEFIKKYRAKWDLWNTAFRYNGNAKKLSNGKTERQDYKEKVIKKYNQLTNI